MSVTSRTPRSSDRSRRSSGGDGDRARRASARPADDRAPLVPEPGVPVAGASLTRQERKARTRQALLDATLERLEDQAFGAISLREVARSAGITPTAFYRHFESMEDLGLVLVDESFRALREMLRVRRAAATEPGDEIRAAVATLVEHVHGQRAHSRFIARERSGGTAPLRSAIRQEIRLFSSQLATDLARYPVLRERATADLQMIADLIVAAAVSAVEQLLDVPPGRPDLEDEIRGVAEDQLRLIVLGALQWRSAS